MHWLKDDVEGEQKSRIWARAGLRSIGIVSASLEIIYAFGGFEDIGADVEGAQQACDGAFGDFVQERLQLGKGLFDWVHVGAVRRQISQFGAGRCVSWSAPLQVDRIRPRF